MARAHERQQHRSSSAEASATKVKRNALYSSVELEIALGETMPVVDPGTAGGQNQTPDIQLTKASDLQVVCQCSKTIRAVDD